MPRGGRERTVKALLHRIGAQHVFGVRYASITFDDAVVEPR